jgi:hypothetical protein
MAPDKHHIDFPPTGCFEQFLAGLSPHRPGVHLADCKAIVQPRRAAYSRMARFCIASVGSFRATPNL